MQNLSPEIKATITLILVILLLVFIYIAKTPWYDVTCVVLVGILIASVLGLVWYMIFTLFDHSDDIGY